MDKECSPMKNDRLFWIGLLVLGFILSGWWDSFRNTTGWEYKWGSTATYRGVGVASGHGVVEIWVGRPYSGVFSTFKTGLQFFREPIKQTGLGIGPLVPFVLDTTIEHRPRLYMAHWGLFLGFFVVWYVGLVIRQKRGVKLGEKGKPTP